MWYILKAVVLLGVFHLPLVLTARNAFLGFDNIPWRHPRTLLQSPSFDPESLVAPRIFKGANVQRKRFECMVSLRKPSSNVHYCGGVLILPNVVLTAAHCMDSGFSDIARDNDDTKTGFSQPNPIAYIGASRVDVQDPDAEVIPSCSTIVHSGWIGRLLGGNDIALIKLQYPSKKTPCPIYSGAPLSEGQKLTALGWGQSESQSFTPVLQKAQNLVFEPLYKCNEESKWFGNISPGMLCADGPSGEDTCDGDSGGPLLIEGSRRGDDQVVGITSFGHVAGCGIAGIPGVYTDLQFRKDWIDREGAGASRVYTVPFCGNPNPNTGDPKDDIAAGIANDNVPGAVSAISRSFKAGDLVAIEAAVQNVSYAGKSENAIEAIVSAANNGSIDGEAAIRLLVEALKYMPATESRILSGGLKTWVQETLRKELTTGNVEAAHRTIVKAIGEAKANDVLQAVSSAVNEGEGDSVVKCLNHAVAKGVDPAKLAAVLARICVGKGEECCQQLLGIGHRHSWIANHSAGPMSGAAPVAESAQLGEKQAGDELD